jgi:hypothetical protein
MRISASAISEDRKKMYAYCGFAAVVALYLYFQFFSGSNPPVAAPAPPLIVTAQAGAARGESTSGAPANFPAGRAAKVVGKTSAALDPTLHMDAMLVTESVAYEGSGRNIFSAASAPPPVVIQAPVAPARPFTPPPPPVRVDTGPPPPPPIDLKFAGYFETPATGEKRAILLHGDDEVLAYAGEIVLRRYRVISITPRSIVVEDMPNDNKQTLPLAN